jgi:hypothetical protein
MCEPEHSMPQPPQLSGSTTTLISQPSLESPLQSTAFGSHRGWQLTLAASQ